MPEDDDGPLTSFPPPPALSLSVSVTDEQWFSSSTARAVSILSCSPLEGRQGKGGMLTLGSCTFVVARFRLLLLLAMRCSYGIVHLRALYLSFPFFSCRDSGRDELTTSA